MNEKDYHFADWFSAVMDRRALIDSGWRIIAVCPPDAQRRPDYIMGRSSEMRKDR